MSTKKELIRKFVRNNYLYGFYIIAWIVFASLVNIQFSNYQTRYDNVIDDYNNLLVAYNRSVDIIRNSSEYQEGYSDGYAKGLQNVTIQQLVTNNVTNFQYSYENNSFKALVSINNFSGILTPNFLNLSTFTLNGSTFTILGSFQYHFEFNTTSVTTKCVNDVCETVNKTTVVNDTYIECFGQLTEPSLEVNLTQQALTTNTAQLSSYILGNSSHEVPLKVYLPLDILTFAYFFNFALGGGPLSNGIYGYIDSSTFKLMFYQSSLSEL